MNQRQKKERNYYDNESKNKDKENDNDSESREIIERVRIIILSLYVSSFTNNHLSSSLL